MSPVRIRCPAQSHYGKTGPARARTQRRITEQNGSLVGLVGGQGGLLQKGLGGLVGVPEGRLKFSGGTATARGSPFRELLRMAEG